MACSKGIETANKVLIPLFALGLAVPGGRHPAAWMAQWPSWASFCGRIFPLRAPACGLPPWARPAFRWACRAPCASCTVPTCAAKRHWPSTAAATCAVDLGAAFLAALFVVPAVLVFGLDLAAGPGLLFDTLPHLFAVMPGGRWLAPLFLLGWALVAMLTIIAVLDTIAGALDDLTGRVPDRRKRLLWLVGVAVCVVMLPIAYNPHWIGILDLVFGSGMFMLGALVAVLAVGWGSGQDHDHPANWPLGFHPLCWQRCWCPGSATSCRLALAAILIGFLFSNDA